MKFISPWDLEREKVVQECQIPEINVVQDPSSQICSNLGAKCLQNT